jgi:hypothetical protein
VPTPWLKCTLVAHQSYQISTDLLVVGDEAESKAHALGSAMIQRTNNIIASQFGRNIRPMGKDTTEIVVTGGGSSLAAVRPATECKRSLCGCQQLMRAFRPRTFWPRKLLHL